MNIDLIQISSKIKESIADLRKGFKSQQKMSPPYRPKFTLDEIKTKGAKEASVLILLYEKNQEIYIAFTLRHTYKGVHSGQISLPGGKFEPEDENFSDTALRETEEEIGIHRQNIDLLGDLTYLFVPPSNFIIHPFVGVYKKEIPNFVKEESEVAEILEIKLTDFLNPQNIKEYKIKNEKYTYTTPAFFINDRIIWGATAMIMSEFLDVVIALSESQ